MQMLCKRIDLLEEKVVSHSEKTTHSRLAETILSLQKTYGLDNRKTIRLELTTEDLASMVGTSKGYLNKIISEFNKLKLINFENKKIRLLNSSKLKELSSIV
jgi:CRP-like cAMP-binding protein